MRYLSSGRARARMRSCGSFAFSSSSRRCALNSVAQVIAMAIGRVEQADFTADGAGGLDVVAGDHLHFDAGGPALRDGLLDIVAQRVADGDEADEDEVLSRASLAAACRASSSAAYRRAARR